MTGVLACDTTLNTAVVKNNALFFNYMESTIHKATICATTSPAEFSTGTAYRDTGRFSLVKETVVTKRQDFALQLALKKPNWSDQTPLGKAARHLI